MTGSIRRKVCVTGLLVCVCGLGTITAAQEFPFLRTSIAKVRLERDSAIIDAIKTDNVARFQELYPQAGSMTEVVYDEYPLGWVLQYFNPHKILAWLKRQGIEETDLNFNFPLQNLSLDSKNIATLQRKLAAHTTTSTAPTSQGSFKLRAIIEGDGIVRFCRADIADRPLANKLETTFRKHDWSPLLRPQLKARIRQVVLDLRVQQDGSLVIQK